MAESSILEGINRSRVRPATVRGDFFAAASTLGLLRLSFCDVSGRVGGNGRFFGTEKRKCD